MVSAILVIVLVLLLAIELYKKLANYFSRHYADIPAVANRWPIVGNVFDMSQTHKVLTRWYKKYGPVYRFSLYGEEIVVLSDYVSVYEALVTKGSDFAGRPRMSRTDYQDRNKNSVVWQTYTPKLQFLRKQIHSSLRMYGNGLHRLVDHCNVEIDQLIARIENHQDLTFDPWDLLYDSACNIMLDLALGVRFPVDGEDLAHLKKINGLFNHTFGPGSSRIIDMFPVLNSFRDEYKALKAAVDMRNSFWSQHADLHNQDGCLGDCVISNLRKCAQDDKYSAYDISESTLKETFTNLILAGTDTTTTAITCLILAFLHNPHVQEQIHKEIDHVIGSRAPTLEDRASMPYTEACLLEILRYTSHVPMAVPHATTCDTTVCGKRIPKNTTVYINLWSVHHDEYFWHKPWQFDPSRFLDADGHLVDTHHENRRGLMAFGAGRRVCIGETLAKNRLFLFTTALLKRFKFVQTGDQLPDFDPRSFTLGIVLHPEKFNVKAVKRTCYKTIVEDVRS